MPTKSTKGKQNKTTREKATIKKKRSSLQKEQEKGGAFFLGRPEKFKSPEELRQLFNCYLASCQELVRLNKEIPVKTIEKEDLDTNTKAAKITENTVVMRNAISEQRKRKKIPTKLDFYLFLGGMSHSTRKSYEIREDFLATVEAINTFFESVLESGGLEGKINPQMVQFVLNTSYGRNPKSVIEETDSFTINEEDLIDD